MSDTKEELRKEVLATIASLDVHRRKYGYGRAEDGRSDVPYIRELEEHLDHLVAQWNALLANQPSEPFWPR